MVYVSLLSVNQTFLSVRSVHKPLLSVCRAGLSVNGPILSVYMSLLSVNQTFLSIRSVHELLLSV